jgi:hypothetical protein
MPAAMALVDELLHVCRACYGEEGLAFHSDATAADPLSPVASAWPNGSNSSVEVTT